MWSLSQNETLVRKAKIFWCWMNVGHDKNKKVGKHTDFRNYRTSLVYTKPQMQQIDPAFVLEIQFLFRPKRSKRSFKPHSYKIYKFEWDEISTTMKRRNRNYLMRLELFSLSTGIVVFVLKSIFITATRTLLHYLNLIISGFQLKLNWGLLKQWRSFNGS